MTQEAKFIVFWDVKPYEINTNYAGKQTYIIPFGSMIPSLGGGGGGGTVDAYTKQQTDTLLLKKADKDAISEVGYSNNYNDLDNKPSNLSDFNNDVGYLTEHQSLDEFYNKGEVDSLLDSKVTKESGKGLSSNDFTNVDKSKVDKIVTSGDGTKYLSDDGSYKAVSGGGGGGVTETEVKGWIARNIAVNNAYGTGIVSPNASRTGSIAMGNSAVSNSNDAIAIGRNSRGEDNQAVALGFGAKAGRESVAVGSSAITDSDASVAVGSGAKAGVSSISIGRGAGANSTAFTNCSHIGINSNTTSNNQVQLGNSTTTTYAYGAVQDRSDARDKAHIRDIQLGLNFITRLRPVEYKWDYREDYFKDIAPQRNDFEDDESYNQALKQARVDFFKNPVKDGSKTRTRYHTGLIAQEVKQVMDDLGVDFGGFQHHQEKGGLDVMSIGYNELTAVLIKSVQELKEEVDKLKNNA